MSEGGGEVTVWKYRCGEGVCEVRDALAGEEPLEIRVRGQAVSVTMRTPGPAALREAHDAELAAGFLLSEGIIERWSDVVAIEPCARPANREGNVVNVFLSGDCVFDPSRLTRHVFASSSCGICGKASIDSIRGQFAPVKSEVVVTPEVLLGLPARLRGAQETFGRTGGLHAAALFEAAGGLLVIREDVGRHNAVDKVIGWALRSGRLPWSAGGLLVSGRVSFEVMQKALAGGVALVAAISAPSSLAVEFAQESGQTLVGFLREGRLNVYTHPRRVFGGG